MKNKNEVYIYLARLDKKGIKVLASFDYPKKVFPTRIGNLSDLNINPNLEHRIAKEAYENRMEYELYAESALSFKDLKNSLTQRGFSHLPLQQFVGPTVPTSINKKALITEDSSMTRKSSDIRR